MARALLLGAAVLGPTGCATYDERVFDDRLRGATFDAYVRTIEAQFDGLEGTGWSADGLAAAYRARAVAAEAPADFYAVMRQVLAELDDPHATLEVSPRFWTGPVAEPESIRFVQDEGRVWLGVPQRSARTPDALRGDLRRWLAHLGADGLADLDGPGIADFLRLSAAFGPENTVRRAHARPLVWFEVESIDGAPVETSHDGELLVRGALGTAARVVTVGDGRLALLRNAGVFEQEDGRAVRRRLHPLALADRLDPGGSLGPANAYARLPFDADVAERRAREHSALLRGRPLRDGAPDDDLFGAEAFAVRTPDGSPVAYLRIGAFRPDPVALEARGLSADDDSIGIDRVLGEAFDELAGFDTWIIDLTGNPGGAWRDAGLFMSYLIPPSDATVPHVVRTVRDGQWLFVRRRVIETTHLARADVPYLASGRRIFVLVDQDTASAGEIVASMLRGRHGATLVGERTAGAEFSTAEFQAPDGSTLRLGLGGGMVAPLESFQGRGLEPDLPVRPAHPLGDGPGHVDPEVWRSVFRYRALDAALHAIDGLPDRDAAP